jgi:hypothetical protein
MFEKQLRALGLLTLLELYFLTQCDCDEQMIGLCHYTSS